jgi:hypothetical protein
MQSSWMKNSFLALAFSGLAFAQDQPPLPPAQQDQVPVQDQNAPQPPAQAQPLPQQPSNGGWRKFGDNQQQPAPAQGGYQGGYSSTVPPPASMPPAPLVPSSLTLPAGTWLTVRTTNPISTDHNQVGDAFSAVLTEPIVVNGYVVARRGQIIQGRVSTAVKAGHVSGTSKLGLELTQVTLVDGEQVTLHSQMVTRDGGTSIGRDAAAIGTTMAAGAAIGAGVNGGVGAGIGAAGGLVASTIGVMLTRGRPAEIYPETVLTFKVLNPITISTANSPGAFHQVSQQDYENNNTRRMVSNPVPRPGYGPGYPPVYGAPYAAAPYPYYGYAPFYGPNFYFYGGRYYRRW